MSTILEEISGDELIGNFMGAEFKFNDSSAVRKSVYYNGRWYKDYSQLKFNSSLDWIISVIYKIQRLSLDPNSGLSTTLGVAWEFEKVLGLPITAPIDKINEKVIEFIKYYNQNKKK